MAVDNRSGRLGKGRSVTGRSDKGIRQRKFNESYQWMSHKERVALITGLIFGFYLSQALEGYSREEIDSACEQVSKLMRGKKIPQSSKEDRFGDNYLGAARQMVKELFGIGVLKSQRPSTEESSGNERDVGQSSSSLSPAELILLGAILLDMLRDELEAGNEHLGVAPLIAQATKRAIQEVTGESFTDDIFPQGITEEDIKEASRIFVAISTFMNLEVFKPSDSK